MVMLAEALSVEREKRQQEAADAATRSEVGRGPRWDARSCARWHSG